MKLILSRQKKIRNESFLCFSSNCRALLRSFLVPRMMMTASWPSIVLFTSSLLSTSPTSTLDALWSAGSLTGSLTITVTLYPEGETWKWSSWLCHLAQTITVTSAALVLSLLHALVNMASLTLKSNRMTWFKLLQTGTRVSSRVGCSRWWTSPPPWRWSHPSCMSEIANFSYYQLSLSQWLSKMLNSNV